MSVIVILCRIIVLDVLSVEVKNISSRGSLDLSYTHYLAVARRRR